MLFDQVVLPWTLVRCRQDVELEPTEALTRHMQLRNVVVQLCKVTISTPGILATKTFKR